MYPKTLLLIGVLATALQSEAYDPLVAGGKVTVADAEFAYGEQQRTVPLRLYLPATKSPAPVILFSHGLGGSRNGSRYLGNHWASHGYVVVMMQHAGSDSAVWKTTPRAQRLSALKKAASLKSFLDRVADVRATLDQLTTWNASDQKFAGRFDVQKIGMSGHSFGAVTTQAVSGQSYGRRGPVYLDKRIKAAIALSPSPPKLGSSTDAFGKVAIPWLTMTGTLDKSVIARTTPEDRLNVFKHLPASGHSYELVLNGAEHMAFSDRTLLGAEHRSPDHHRAIKALSTAFWDSHLQGQQDAKAWLQGDVANRVLADKDVWQRK